ncbi:hypothetical protein [Schumannella soli]|uniref:Uncharacterized protein n=1 Tax=Schumannella soli TaxID=2590779 RepID=A0A506Y7S5_9MICO|nr:hypothetical protein [Schumannella soli]TPW78085.1 hypothetical protein FJ657_05515 [Schumannella soli]
MNSVLPADRTMLAAIGQLTVAALQLQATRDRAELVFSTDAGFDSWNINVRQALEHHSRIQTALAEAQQIGNTIHVTLNNGARVPADAAYFDRLTEKLTKMHRVGILRGYTDTAHALVGDPHFSAGRSTADATA